MQGPGCAAADTLDVAVMCTGCSSRGGGASGSGMVVPAILPAAPKAGWLLLDAAAPVLLATLPPSRAASTASPATQQASAADLLVLVVGAVRASATAAAAEAATADTWAAAVSATTPHGPVAVVVGCWSSICPNAAEAAAPGALEGNAHKGDAEAPARVVGDDWVLDRNMIHPMLMQLRKSTRY
jgi:hypothetical protein